MLFLFFFLMHFTLLLISSVSDQMFWGNGGQTFLWKSERKTKRGKKTHPLCGWFLGSVFQVQWLVRSLDRLGQLDLFHNIWHLRRPEVGPLMHLHLFNHILISQWCDLICCAHALSRKQKVLLVFDGVDTISTISLNGVVLGRTDNMFRRYVRGREGGVGGRLNAYIIVLVSVFCSSWPFLQDFPVTELLQDGENVLKVSFMSPVLYASERSKAHVGARVPPECPPDVQKGECHVNFIRKVLAAVCSSSLPDCPAAQSFTLSV